MINNLLHIVTDLNSNIHEVKIYRHAMVEYCSTVTSFSLVIANIEIFHYNINLRNNVFTINPVSTLQTVVGA